MALRVLHVGGNQAEELNDTVSKSDSGETYLHIDIDGDHAVSALKWEQLRGLSAIMLYPDTLDEGVKRSPYPTVQICRGLRKVNPYLSRRSALCETDTMPQTMDNRFLNAEVFPPPYDMKVNVNFPDALRNYLEILGKPMTLTNWRRWGHWVTEKCFNPHVYALLDIAQTAHIFDTIVGKNTTNVEHEVERVEKWKNQENRAYFEAHHQRSAKELLVGVINDIRHCTRQVEKVRAAKN